MNKKKIGILSAIGYIAIMAVAMFTIGHIYHLNYKNPEMVRVLVYFELVMILYSAYIYMKFFGGTAFRKLRITPTFIIFSLVILSTFIIYLATGDFKGHGSILPLVVITTLLVGVSEELMFRGIVLSAFLEKENTVKAIIVSALLFALLHSVNILGGLPVKEMLIQLFSAFIYGVMTGCFRIRVKNIFPFMIYHFLWDMMLITSSFVDPAIGMFTLLVSILELVLAIILLISVAKENKKRLGN